MACPDWFWPLHGPIGSGTCTCQPPSSDDAGRRGAQGSRAVTASMWYALLKATWSILAPAIAPIFRESLSQAKGMCTSV